MNKFKIGDRVRVKDAPNPEWMSKTPPLPDAIFKVEGTQKDKLILSMECSDMRFVIDAKHFELVESSEQTKNMSETYYEPISEVESYIVNQAKHNALVIKGRLKDPDPKTAFLTEMQELLERYDMTIGTFEGCTVPTMPYGVMFGSRYQNGDDIYVFYDMPVISSDNIFDYEKE